MHKHYRKYKCLHFAVLCRAHLMFGRLPKCSCSAVVTMFFAFCQREVLSSISTACSRSVAHRFCQETRSLPCHPCFLRKLEVCLERQANDRSGACIRKTKCQNNCDGHRNSTTEHIHVPFALHRTQKKEREKNSSAPCPPALPTYLPNP